MDRKWLKPESKLNLVLLWTLYAGLGGGLIMFLFLIIAAASASDWDLRLIPLPIIASAVFFAVNGLIFSSVYVLISALTGKKRGG